MTTELARYVTDDGTEVMFEFEPTSGQGDDRPVGLREAAGHVRRAVQPAVKAASEILSQVKLLQLEQVEIRFGVKVNGDANWIVARASTAANFEVCLTWKSSAGIKNSMPLAAESTQSDPICGLDPEASTPHGEHGGPIGE